MALFRPSLLRRRVDLSAVAHLAVNYFPEPNTEMNAEINVRVTRMMLKVAPERVTFQVSSWKGFQTKEPSQAGVYDPRLHDIAYVADFGDGDSVYSAPEKGLNTWRDRNVGFGPLVTHLYRRPGVYKVRIWAYELHSDRQAMWETDITVADPAVVFPRRATAYISVERDFSNAPEGASFFTSLAGAIEARQYAPATRYMLRAGERHRDLQNMTLVDRGATRKVGHSYFVADVPREKDGQSYRRPVLNTRGEGGGFFTLRALRPDVDIVLQGLDLRGLWDSTTETGANRQSGLRMMQTTTSTRHLVFDDCRFSGFDRCIDGGGGPGSNDAESGITVHDCTMTNWRDYGFYCGGASHVEILGTTIAHSVDALAGGPKNREHNAHGPVRLQTGSRMFVQLDGCDFFSRTGWFENLKGYRTQQACLRMNQSLISGSILNLQRSAFEGGWEVIKLDAMNDTIVEHPQNYLLDKFIIVGSHMTNKGISAMTGGITIRNGLMIMPDVERLAGLFDPSCLLHAGEPVNNPEAVLGAVQVYHNTLLNLMRDASSAGGDARMRIVENRSGSLTVQQQNNVLYQPNLTKPDVEQGPLASELLWVPRERGYVSSSIPNRMKHLATPLDTVQLGAPTGESKALGSAFQDPILHYDIFGRKRPSTPSVGALEHPKND